MHMFQASSVITASGRAVLVLDRDTDRAQASVQLEAGCLSSGIRQSKREHGPEPWDTEGQQ